MVLMRKNRLARILILVAACLAFLYGLSAVFGSQILGSIMFSSASGSTPRSALVSLVKQRDMFEIVETVRNVEDRYNRNFHHDWVFLSEENFKPEFINTVSAFVSGDVKFRTVNRKVHWTIPDHIDRKKLKNDMHNLDALGVPYGGSNSYRLMSRFQSGYFMEYLPEYRYYARIDHDVKFFCDVEEDFFAKLHQENKKVGFTLSLQEVPHAVHDLSKVASDFMETNPDLIHANQWMDKFVKPWDPFCHFWTNFEVGDLDFFRSEPYKKLFDFLESDGGFFYNRWGDAPVHTLAMSLFLDPSEVHWFRDIGMYHNPNVNCPTSNEDRLRLRCSCPHGKTIPAKDRNNIFTYREQSCIPHFLNLTSEKFQDGWTDYADASVLNMFDSSLKNI